MAKTHNSSQHHSFGRHPFKQATIYFALLCPSPATAPSVNIDLCLRVSPASWSHLRCPSRTSQSATASSLIPAASSPSQRRRVRSVWPALSTTRVTSIATCCWCEPARAWTAWAVQQRFVFQVSFPWSTQQLDSLQNSLDITRLSRCLTQSAQHTDNLWVLNLRILLPILPISGAAHRQLWSAVFAAIVTYFQGLNCGPRRYTLQIMKQTTRGRKIPDCSETSLSWTCI